MHVQKLDRRTALLPLFDVTGKLKLPAVRDYIMDMLEGGRKFIVFGHHRSVLDGLCEALDNKVRITSLHACKKGFVALTKNCPRQQISQAEFITGKKIEKKNLKRQIHFTIIHTGLSPDCMIIKINYIRIYNNYIIMHAGGYRSEILPPPIVPNLPLYIPWHPRPKITI